MRKLEQLTKQRKHQVTRLLSQEKLVRQQVAVQVMLLVPTRLAVEQQVQTVQVLVRVVLAALIALQPLQAQTVHNTSTAYVVSCLSLLTQKKEVAFVKATSFFIDTFFTPAVLLRPGSHL